MRAAMSLTYEVPAIGDRGPGMGRARQYDSSAVSFLIPSENLEAIFGWIELRSPPVLFIVAEPEPLPS